jgi:hypothetical protein
MPPVKQLNSLKAPTEFVTSQGCSGSGSAALPTSVTKVFVHFLRYTSKDSWPSAAACQPYGVSHAPPQAELCPYSLLTKPRIWQGTAGFAHDTIALSRF